MAGRGKQTITLGKRVGIDDVVAIARGGARVTIGPDARRRLRQSRAVVDRLAAGEKAIYGLNTGLGAGVDTRLSPDEMSDFQARVLIARSVGIGPRLSTAEVRALLAARLIGLTAGAAGISPRLAEKIADMLNKGVHPLVPQIASVGESDLAPLSHALSPLIGAGEAELGGKVMPGAKAMKRAGIKRVALGPKDGIALVSANSASLGLGALVLHDTSVVLAAQRAALALSLEGFRGNLDPFDPRLAGRERDRLPAAGGNFEQAAKRVFARAGNRAGAENVARPQIAAATRVMRHELGHGPIEMARVARGQPMRREPLLPQAGREQQNLELDIERAGCLVAVVEQVGQGSWIAGRARRLCDAKRR
jgi:histidine ammonia-lyase